MAKQIDPAMNFHNRHIDEAVRDAFHDIGSGRSSLTAQIVHQSNNTLLARAERIRSLEGDVRHWKGLANDNAERARALECALDAAMDFLGTVAGGASWWDDVWAEHQTKIDAMVPQPKKGLT